VSVSVITLGAQAVNLVAMPSSPGIREVEFSLNDAVAAFSSSFTGQLQPLQWKGAELWTGTMTLPVMKQSDAAIWTSFLMELRGMANAFQIGDPLKSSPRGTGGVASAGAAATGSQTLATSFGAGALLVGDYMQIGYRLYRALEPTGVGPIGVWPSIREPLVGAEGIITNNPVGIFRLATNKRTWSADQMRYTRLSFQVREYR
jgi:hypothetical protein